MLKRLSLAAAVAVCLSTPALAEPLKVVASFSILGDMVREVGGDSVSVTTLVGPDGDAHVYQPSPADAKAVAQADLVILNGLGFEPWGDRLLKASETKAAVAKAAEGVKPLMMEAEEGYGHGEEKHGHDHDHDHDHDGEVPDPHAWQDLINGKLYVANIATALKTARPADAAAIQARADAYSKRLSDLDAWVRAELSAVPEAERKVITGHDAFGYFGKAYGITFLAPVGVSTEAEPTPKDIAELVRQMKAEKVKAVFVENMSDPRLVEQLAKDAGGVVGGTLYADALSAENGPAATYETMFRHNVTALTAALAGK